MLVGKRSEAIDGKETRITSRTELAYRSGGDIPPFFASIPFASGRGAGNESQSKNRGTEYGGTLETRRVFLGNEDSRKPCSNGGSPWKVGERKSKSAEKLLVKVDETSYPCQRSLIIADRYFKTLPEILFPSVLFNRILDLFSL